MKTTAILWIAFVAVLLLRLVTLSSTALIDPSEGRYASIAQEMYLSNDWITLKTYKDGELIPFLAKPPLHTWVTAVSFSVFGINEFAARFPSFFSAALILFLIIYISYIYVGVEIGLFAAIVCMSSGLFFIISGACITDMLLTFSTVLSGVSFFRFAHTQTFSNSNLLQRGWGLGFFVGLAAGMLTKGPVALVLVAIPILIFLYQRRNFALLLKLPWALGTLMFLFIAAPWYFLEEKAQPGFLNYFFIHENFLRFLSKDYGDRYGSAHSHPYGSIWLMLLGSFLPFSLLVFGLVYAKGRKCLNAILTEPIIQYSFIWGLTPALFFTFAKQVSIYYVLPGIPWLSIVTGYILYVWWKAYKTPAFYRVTSILVSPAALLSLILLGFGGYLEVFSTRELIKYLHREPRFNGKQIYFLNKVPQSAYFYSREDASVRLQPKSVSLDLVVPENSVIVAQSAKGKNFNVLSSWARETKIDEVGRWAVLKTR